MSKRIRSGCDAAGSKRRKTPDRPAVAGVRGANFVLNMAPKAIKVREAPPGKDIKIP